VTDRDPDARASTPLGGHWQNPIEVDETYIGGKARNKHLSQRKQAEKKSRYWNSAINDASRHERDGISKIP
jgi:hypothetical protein